MKKQTSPKMLNYAFNGMFHVVHWCIQLYNDQTNLLIGLLYISSCKACKTVLSTKLYSF